MEAVPNMTLEKITVSDHAVCVDAVLPSDVEFID